MARTNRPPSEHLSFLARAGETARHWGLFPVLRGAEARAPGLPRIGRSKSPSENIVDLAQTPGMGFTGSTIDSIEQSGGRSRVSGSWLGLLGPMGPMPSHVTEFVQYEARYAKSRPFGRFLDMLAGRMLQLFYRAWADSQPAAQFDRPLDDGFADQLAALSGARDGVPNAFPANARLYYAGLFASRRSPAAIEDLMTEMLGQPARVIEYQPCWRALEPGDQTRLGRGDFSVLGQGAMLGGRARIADDAFRVVVSAGSAEDHAALLPGGRSFPVAAAALDAITPGHLSWEIQLELRERDAAPARLGGDTQLGWSSWMLGASESPQWRGDTHLRRGSVLPESLTRAPRRETPARKAKRRNRK